MTRMIPALEAISKEHMHMFEHNSNILQLVESFPAALKEITAISHSVRVLEITALSKGSIRTAFLVVVSTVKMLS